MRNFSCLLLRYLLSTNRSCLSRQLLVNARVQVQHQCSNFSSPSSNTAIMAEKMTKHYQHILRVEQLPSAVTEEALREFYSQFGLLLNCKLVCNEKSKHLKSCAYLTFASREGLSKASASRPHVILGQSVISRSARLRQIIIENLPTETTQESLERFYVKFGRVVNCVVLKGAKACSLTGLVMFAAEENVDSAMADLPHVIHGKEVEVRICNPSALTLLIYNLASTTTAAKLQEVFSKFDPIVKCSVRKDLETGSSRCFGDLRFSSEQELQSALEAQPIVIDGESVRLSYKEEAHKLFLPELPPALTEESLKKFFSNFDPDVNCKIALEKGTDRMRDFATISFSSKEAIKKAKLARPFIIEGIKINALDKGVGRSKRCTIFVGGLAYKTTRESFHKFFEKFGLLEEAEIKWDKEKNRSRGFGFVRYSTVKAAQKALAGEPYKLDGRRIGVKIKLVEENSA